MENLEWLNGQATAKNATAEFELTSLRMKNGEHPKFRGLQAGGKNTAYTAALIKATSNKGARKAARGVIDEAEIEDQQKRQRSLYAKHVLVGWNLIDNADSPIPFTPAAAESVLAQLNDENFGALQDFFSNEANFTNDALSETEAAEVGNGSQNKSSGA